MNTSPIFGCPIEISAILYEDDGVWIAQGIEFDITARGDSPDAAAQRFDTKVGAELVMSFELDDESPLSGVGPAPQKFWRMFQEARHCMEHERAPQRILDGGLIPRILQRMKIGQLQPA